MIKQILYILYNFHICLAPNIIYYLKFLIVLFYLNFLFFLWHTFFKEIQFQIIKDMKNFYKKRFDNLESPEFVTLSYYFKITSFKNTLLKIFIYFMFSFFAIFCLRISRLGTSININHVIIKILALSFLTKILLIIVIILYIYIFANIWGLMTQHLFKKKKKLHIFFYIAEDMLDPFCKNNSDYYEILEKPLKRLISFKYGLYHIYDKQNEYWNDFSLKEFKKSYNVSPILIPIFFILSRSYKINPFINSIKYLFKFLDNHFWVILKFIPMCGLCILLFYEIISNKGLITHIFYLLPIIFFYHSFINLIYFFYHTNKNCTKYICLCYYKKNDLYSHNPYGRRLRNFYNIYTTFEKDEYIKLYISNDLNWMKTLSDIKEKNNKNEKHII